MKTCDNIKKIIKEHWILLLILCLFPVVINYVVLIPSFLPVVGDSEKWLSFFGSFSGSVIMAGVTLYVLKTQLKQNHDENEKNRKTNELANEKNRKLQIKILEYQQQIQWLNSFRQASAEYVKTFNANDLIAITNTLVVNPQEAHNMLKLLLDSAKTHDIQLAYFRKMDNNTEELMKKIAPKFDQYNDVIQDIQQIIIFKQKYPMAGFSQFVSQISTMELSQDMKDKIAYVSTQQSADIIQPFINVMLMRIDDIRDNVVAVQTWLYDYIHSEQARIDKILDIDYGTR